MTGTTLPFVLSVCRCGTGTPHSTLLREKNKGLPLFKRAIPNMAMKLCYLLGRGLRQV